MPQSIRSIITFLEISDCALRGEQIAVISRLPDFAASTWPMGHCGDASNTTKFDASPDHLLEMSQATSWEAMADCDEHNSPDIQYHEHGSVMSFIYLECIIRRDTAYIKPYICKSQKFVAVWWRHCLTYSNRCRRHYSLCSAIYIRIMTWHGPY